ncbi:DUF4384 domain-containing protein [Diaphorobacter sp. HDW4B]|uniref:caspase family protein n=1 Tax=Diaphorobacter sp. HDW4B TaxID=2714925 RepID=UPI00140B2044|nr:caspase family protein [Diaphorobacter sp. HDW4B]QIL73078.1 DUF4384 domain-containing protein [Diaphorobacter sp. HDW4B]
MKEWDCLCRRPRSLRGAHPTTSPWRTIQISPHLAAPRNCNAMTNCFIQLLRALRHSGLALTFSMLAALTHAAPNKVALLVGVGQYPDPENRLQGPANDVEALRQVLVQRWGYAPANVQVLVDQAATRKEILQALQGLMQRTQADDEVLVYFSGHGTSALDPALGLPLPHGSGAFIPIDAQLGSPNVLNQLIVGRTDLRPVFDQLDKGGRKVWFVSDSCYSGQQVRSFTSEGLPSRMVPLRQAAAQSLMTDVRQRFQQNLQQNQDWPYRNVVFLAAGAEGEAAKDIPAGYVSKFPTVDGKAHGAMTDALLRVLNGQLPVDANGDGVASLHEVHQAVATFMAQRAYGHTPQRLPSVRDDAHATGQRALLSGAAVVGVPSVVVRRPFGVAVHAGITEDVVRRILAIPDVSVTDAASPAMLRLALSRDQRSFQLATQGGDLVSSASRDDVGRLLGTVQQMAWVERMDAMAIQSRRAVLPAEIAPAALGGNFRIGDMLHFVVRPDRDAFVLLLNVDSVGKVSVLYPYFPQELAAIPAGTARAIPGDRPNERIQVQEPLGMDVQLLFAFDQMPAEMARWVKRTDIAPGDPSLLELERMVQSNKGLLSYARTELRVEAK